MDDMNYHGDGDHQTRYRHLQHQMTARLSIPKGQFRSQVMEAICVMCGVLFATSFVEVASSCCTFQNDTSADPKQFFCNLGERYLGGSIWDEASGKRHLGGGIQEKASGEASRGSIWRRQLGEGIWEETSEKASGRRHLGGDI